MATIQDLMGLGMPPRTASQLGYTPQNVTGAGTTQATATTIPPGFHLTILTSTTGATGCVFASAAANGIPNIVYCATGSTVTGVVYCPVSGTMNESTNAGLSVIAGKAALFIQTTAGKYVSILTA